MSRISSSRFSCRYSSRQASRFATVFAIRWRFRIAFRVSPVPFLRASLSFSRPFPVSPRCSRSRNRSIRGVPCRLMPCVPCRRSAPRSVLLRVRRGVSPFEAWGGEGDGEFYGMFHVKRGTSPCIFRCLLGAVYVITQACWAFPCDGWIRFRAVIMSCWAFRICRIAAFSVPPPRYADWQ